MTANELIQFFNDRFILGEWPDKYEVDCLTYANVCQAVFEHESTELIYFSKKGSQVKITLGPNHGIMFKNVELILKK